VKTLPLPRENRATASAAPTHKALKQLVILSNAKDLLFSGELQELRPVEGHAAEVCFRNSGSCLFLQKAGPSLRTTK
jgi:hypothetical protein